MGVRRRAVLIPLATAVLGACGGTIAATVTNSAARPATVSAVPQVRAPAIERDLSRLQSEVLTIRHELRDEESGPSIRHLLFQICLNTSTTPLEPPGC